MAGKKTTVGEFSRVTLSINETIELIMHQFRQVVLLGPKAHGLMFFLEGMPGIGKTQMIEQIRQRMSEELKTRHVKALSKTEDYQHFMRDGGKGQKGEAHLGVLNLSAKDSQDFSGMPMVNDDGEQSFAHPDTLPEKGYGIIFYDEANRVFDLDMKATLLSLWMDRGVNGHFLGDGYMQIAAGNPFDLQEFHTDKPDPALAERYRIIRVQPKISEVIAFLENRYETHFLLNYLKESPEFCNVASGSADGDSFSPRTIDKAMEITMTLKDDYEENQPLIKTLLEVYFGSIQASKIVNFLNDNKEMSFDRIMKNNALAKKLKITDVPVMKKLTKEMFDEMVVLFESPKPKLGSDMKKTMDLIIEKMNNESKKVWLDMITAYPKHSEILDFLLDQHKPFMGRINTATQDF
jgi:hypothetical protein